MKTIDILRAAREKISKPGTWTQNATARDADGCQLLAIDPGAVSWCAYGAIIAVSLREGHIAAIESVCRCTGAESLGVWNDRDGRTHAEVLAAFDKAIAAEEYEDYQ